jgi:drug/metabolite transporter (DMT)-like permease
MLIDKTRKAYVMLFITSFGWALSTILMKMYIQDISVFHLMFGRFLIAFLLVSLFKMKKLRKITFEQCKMGFLAGIMLFSSYALSIYGLKITTASKSGFLVSLSVLFVPLIQLIINKKRPNKWTSISVMFSVLGLYLISGMNGAGFNFGDVLSILCAAAYTGYIFLIDKYTKAVDEESLVLMILLSITLMSFLAMVSIEGFDAKMMVTNWKLIFTIAIFGTAIATLFQAKAQKHASPESVGLILLGEPLITLLLAITILGEQVMFKGMIGAVIILCSLGITVIKEI